MNRTIGLQLVGYSLVLAGLSLLTYHIVPLLGQATLITGLAGGILCLIWGVRAALGHRGKALSILTLIPVNFVLLSQAITGWMGGGEELQGRYTGAGLTTLLFVLSVAMLTRIAYAGVVFDGQVVGPTGHSGAKPQTTGRPGGQANAVKRA
jgi:hypothetical protein